MGHVEKTSLYFPSWLKEALRQEAFHTRRSQTEIIVEDLAQRYADPSNRFFCLQAKEKLDIIREDKVSSRTDQLDEHDTISAHRTNDVLLSHEV